MADWRMPYRTLDGRLESPEAKIALKMACPCNKVVQILRSSSPALTQFFIDECVQSIECTSLCMCQINTTPNYFLIRNANGF